MFARRGRLQAAHRHGLWLRGSLVTTDDKAVAQLSEPLAPGARRRQDRKLLRGGPAGGRQGRITARIRNNQWNCELRAAPKKGHWVATRWVRDDIVRQLPTCASPQRPRKRGGGSPRDVSSAMFLILEFSQSYSGVYAIRASRIVILVGARNKLARRSPRFYGAGFMRSPITLGPWHLIACAAFLRLQRVGSFRRRHPSSDTTSVQK